MPIIGIIDSAKTGNIDTNSFFSIATVVASGSSPTLSLTSIPATYQHLQVRVFGGNIGYSPYMTFNSDTANNYSRHRLSTNSTTVSVGGSASFGGIPIANQAGLVLTTSGLSSPAIVDILDYANTNKNTTTRGVAGWNDNTNGYIDFESGAWYNTAAINRIDFTMATGNWSAGSSIALYGIKG
jgi:hypothetical protein